MGAYLECNTGWVRSTECNNTEIKQ